MSNKIGELIGITIFLGLWTGIVLLFLTVVATIIAFIVTGFGAIWWLILAFWSSICITSIALFL